MSDDFAPCPFCGETEEESFLFTLEQRPGDKTMSTVRCANCGAIGPEAYAEDGDPLAAGRAARYDWNDRTTPAEKFAHEERARNHLGVLNMEMPDTCHERTVGEFLRKSLQAFIHEGESFSGKSPLGDSGWDWELAGALIKGGVISGTYDEDVGVEDVDWSQFREVMRETIDTLFGVDG